MNGIPCTSDPAGLQPGDAGDEGTFRNEPAWRAALEALEALEECIDLAGAEGDLIRARRHLADWISRNS